VKKEEKQTSIWHHSKENNGKDHSADKHHHNASQTMAVEYGPKKIRFNAVSPVIGSTGM